MIKILLDNIKSEVTTPVNTLLFYISGSPVNPVIAQLLKSVQQPLSDAVQTTL